MAWQIWKPLEHHLQEKTSKECIHFRKICLSSCSPVSSMGVRHVVSPNECKEKHQMSFIFCWTSNVSSLQECDYYLVGTNWPSVGAENADSHTHAGKRARHSDRKHPERGRDGIPEAHQHQRRWWAEYRTTVSCMPLIWSEHSAMPTLRIKNEMF